MPTWRQIGPILSRAAARKPLNIAEGDGRMVQQVAPAYAGTGVGGFTKRSPVNVAVLGIVTIGIYYVYWLVKTKTELNQHGGQIPTAWMLIIPGVNIYWLWKYAEGVDVATKQAVAKVTGFLLLWILAPIGAYMVQDALNKAA
jgi:hypothetical protein